jgi:CRISPR-associated protein Cas2
VIDVIRVVSYDITDDRTRQQVSKILEGYLNRVQYSVFEGELEEERFTELQSKLEQEFDGSEDQSSIRFYTLCRHCLERTSVWGKGGIQIDPDHYLV